MGIRQSFSTPIWDFLGNGSKIQEARNAEYIGTRTSTYGNESMVKPLGIKPDWIFIHSKVASYKNIAKISQTAAKIVTIRYRSKKMVEEAKNIEDWEVVRLKRT
jgi:hypothetical protein